MVVDNGHMSDDPGQHVRQPPRSSKRTAEVSIADFTMLVSVSGKPAAVRVYTDDEGEEAALYAAQVGGVVVPLPLSPPAGYVAGADGTLVPAATAENGRPLA